MKYRADIDGLRAIAVLCVIFYHYGVAWFPGGYVGVDVFYVISGYLISSLIFRQLRQSKFKFTDFYFRRIRRLVPAYFVVVLVVSVVAFYLMLPIDFYKYGKSLVAATVYSSNILFFKNSGYFDASSELKPLLHTWSLSVEEQFYIVFPFLAWILYKLNNLLKATVFVLLTIVSFFAATYYIQIDQSAVFYLYPFRAWEMFIGVILALELLPEINSKASSIFLMILGLSLIIIPSVLYTSITLFPGWTALAPCIGAALLIYSGACNQTPLHLLLSNSLTVSIGKISYSLYLWHWPIFVFFTYVTNDNLTILQISIILILTFLFSYISWKFVEIPFRTGKAPASASKISVFSLASAISILFVVFGYGVYRTNGMPGRFTPEENRYARAASDLFGSFESCNMNEDNNVFPGLPYCAVGDPESADDLILVWGDSHAGAFKDGLTATLEKHNMDALIVWSGGCPPLFDIEKHESVSSKIIDDKCTFRNYAIKEFIKERYCDIRALILIGRWSYYINGNGFGIDADNTIRLWNTDEKYNEKETQEDIFLQSFENTIDQLKLYKFPIYVVEQPPEFSEFTARKYAINYIHGKIDSLNRIITESYENVLKRQGSFLKLITNLEKDNSISIINTHQYFCHNSRCTAVIDYMPVYMDNNHISTYGSRLISDIFLRPLLFEKAKSNVSGKYSSQMTFNINCQKDMLKN